MRFYCSRSVKNDFSGHGVQNERILIKNDPPHTQKSNLGHFWRSVSIEISQNERILIKNDPPLQKSNFGHFWRSHTMSLLPVSQTWFLQRVSLKKVRSLGRPRNENCPKNAKKATFCCTILYFFGPSERRERCFPKQYCKIGGKIFVDVWGTKNDDTKFLGKKDHGLAYISFSSIFVEGEWE